MASSGGRRVSVAVAIGASVGLLLFGYAAWQRRPAASEKGQESPQASRDSSNPQQQSAATAEAAEATEVDLHGRPWRRNSTRAERAAYWAEKGGVAKAKAEEAAAASGEVPLVVPLTADGASELSINASTLPRWLTVVITTSPVTSNPSTDLIEEVAKSMATVPHLACCPKLIICDGYKVREKNKFRSGEITADRVAAYAAYKANLRALAADPLSCMAGAVLLELEERQGFGFAMKEGIRHVATPFVIVVQHDRNFLAAAARVDLVQLVRAMRRHR